MHEGDCDRHRLRIEVRGSVPGPWDGADSIELPRLFSQAAHQPEGSEATTDGGAGSKDGHTDCEWDGMKIGPVECTWIPSPGGGRIGCRAEETEAGAGAGWEEEAGVVPSAGHVASRVCSRA